MDSTNQSNFNIVTTTRSSKKEKRGLIIGAVIIFFIAISVVVGVYLVKQQQNIREKAQVISTCPAAEQCPVVGNPKLLRTCSYSNDGEAPQDISCSSVDNVNSSALCRGITYYCPVLGADWTTSPPPSATPTSTPTLTPTPTATESATPTGSATPSATARATATSSASPTTVPIPITGVSWPTVIGAGVGILVIIGSIFLVL
jgi:hypothetical protein